MSEYTLSDLVEESGGSAADAAAGGSDADTGEWLMDFYEKMRDDGYLDPLMKQMIGETRDMEQIQSERKTAESADDAEAANTTETMTNANDLSAETVKNLMLELYDHAESLPMLSDDPKLSELIKLIDANPEMADKLIQEHL